MVAWEMGVISKLCATIGSGIFSGISFKITSVAEVLDLFSFLHPKIPDNNKKNKATFFHNREFIMNNTTISEK